jgi:DNA mismatch repair protein MutL
LSEQTSTIQLLSEIVANQIAAGEVVERPASVVKELVENSLDAGATEITVVTIDGGRSLIQIIDNGRGMSAVDAKLSLKRFATSKLTSVEDFDRLNSFGFRGEALPSISSVAKLTLETCNGSETTRLNTEGGNVISESSFKSDSAPGTTFIVRDLFYNVPARRSFLKSERSELSLIKSVLSDFAVSRPEVRITLVVDGETNLLLPAKKSNDSFQSFIERVQDLKLSSSDVLQCSAEIDTPSGKYRIQAGLTKPLDCVAGAAKLRLIVNGRGVRDKILIRAIRDGYGTFLRGDRFPAGVVKLEVPPQDIDVNVHPQKAEIRFRSPDRVFSITRQALGVALRSVEAGSSFSSGSFPAPDSAYHIPAGSGSSYGIDRASPTSFSFKATTSAETRATEARALISQGESLGSSRYLGQIFNCYLLFEKLPESFVIVDMHAAHERITQAKIKKAWSDGEVISQKLLLPEAATFPPHLAGEEDELISILESLGFEIEKVHQTQFIIRGVPELLARVSPRELVADLLSEISIQDLQGALERKVDSVLNRIACHGSVRSGQQLSDEEAYQLVDDLDSTELRAFCPHGRSVARVMTRNDLEKLFGRSE